MNKPNLNQLLKDEAPIYICNNTNPRGNIVLTFLVSGGRQSKTLIVPPSRFPVAVHDQVPHSVLKDSLEFREYLTKKILVLVDEEQALRELAHPDAKAEIALATRSKFAMDEAAEDDVNDEGSADSGITDDVSRKINPKLTINIYPRVMGIVSELNIGDTGVTDAMTELNSLAAMLEKKDYDYIIAKCDKKRIADWAKRQVTGGKSPSKAVSKKTKTRKKTTFNK